MKTPDSFAKFFDEKCMMKDAPVDIFEKTSDAFFIGEVVTVGADGKFALTEKYKDYPTLCKVPKLHHVPKS